MYCIKFSFLDCKDNICLQIEYLIESYIFYYLKLVCFSTNYAINTSDPLLVFAQVIFIFLFQLYIKPYHYAVFNVSIVAPEVKGAYVSEIWMFTQFQDLFIPITFRAAEGSLHAIPDKFIFDKVYPVTFHFMIFTFLSFAVTFYN